jgi:hypothetical protein
VYVKSENLISRPRSGRAKEASPRGVSRNERSDVVDIISSPKFFGDYLGPLVVELKYLVLDDEAEVTSCPFKQAVEEPYNIRFSTDFLPKVERRYIGTAMVMFPAGLPE